MQTSHQTRKSKVGYQFVKSVRLASRLPGEKEIDRLLKRSPKQKLVFDLLQQKEINLSELETLIPGGRSALRGLKEKNWWQFLPRKKNGKLLFLKAR